MPFCLHSCTELLFVICLSGTFGAQPISMKLFKSLVYFPGGGVSLFPVSDMAGVSVSAGGSVCIMTATPHRSLTELSIGVREQKHYADISYVFSSHIVFPYGFSSGKPVGPTAKAIISCAIASKSSR